METIGNFERRSLVKIDHLPSAAPGAVRLGENILFGFGVVKLGGCGVERDSDVLADFVTGFFNGGCNGFQSGLIAFQVWGKPALVSPPRWRALYPGELLSRCEKPPLPCGGLGENYPPRWA